MKKMLTLILLVSISFAAVAQNIENKIPYNADAVVTTNGNQILELVSLVDLDNSIMGKEILKDVNRSKEEKINSLADMGVDLTTRSYYFFQNTDSVSYNNFIMKLNSKAKFEATLSNRDKKKLKTENGISYIQDYGGLRAWNDNLFLFVNGQKSYTYFDIHKERFKKQAKDENESKYDMNRRIVNSWILNHAKNLINNNAKKSIASNVKFQNAKAKGAAGTFWVRHYGDIMNSMISASMGAVSGLNYPRYLMGGNRNLYGFEEITGNLFFDQNTVRLSMSMGLTQDMEKAYKKIYNKKMNSRFLSHLDQNNILGYWSLSVNTEEMLKEYPFLIKNIYGGMLPEYNEEIEASADLFSILIDEEEIGELLTGDMLVVLNNFDEQDVEYKTYEYDEEYNRKEVTKTKKELVPDFTLMVGSKKEKFLNKLYRIGLKHKVLEADGGIFQFMIPKSEIPFNIYSVVKDDILFITSSKKRAIGIKNNKTYTNNTHTKSIKKNSMVMYVDGQRLSQVIPEKELSKSEKKKLQQFTENFRDAYFKTSRVKNGKVSSEFIINTNGKEENSLKLFFKVLEDIVK